jgi:hypothetical protein
MNINYLYVWLQVAHFPRDFITSFPLGNKCPADFNHKILSS